MLLQGLLLLRFVLFYFAIDAHSYASEMVT